MPPDPKPKKRVRDKDLMRRLHLELQGEPCEGPCGGIRRGVVLHHKTFRSQGGDDTRANLAWLLCPLCHDTAHGL